MRIYSSSYYFQNGQGAVWQASAPSGLTIVGAGVPSGELYSDYVNMPSGGQYTGYFYWYGGKSNITPDEPGVTIAPIGSSYFGFFMGCAKSSCSGLPAAQIQVHELNLQVHETQEPVIQSPTGLWQTTSWIRGTWPVTLSGDSPSGICELAVKFNGTVLPESRSSQDPSQWHQCAAAPLNDQVNTNDYPQGSNQLVVGAFDAAGAFVSYQKPIYVDNQPPAISLSGPSDAASSAGTQYVTATATAGPSGVAGIRCWTDGGPGQWHPSSTAQIPVSGVGEHTVKCLAENKATNSSGVRGASPASTFAMKIGEPTVTAVGFSKVVNGLRCRRISARGRRATQCHVRTQRHRIAIWVTVRRHGRRVRIREHKVVRVILTPHTVQSLHAIVRHGYEATVDGWLGTASGQALGGQRVDVLTVPDDGRSNYSVAAVARTAADGSWSARLRAGPSRLITASYAGGSTTQPSLSRPARLVVPARVRLTRVRPRHVAWGGTVKLAGRLIGGYLPPGGALVRLRIGYGASFTTYGVHEHVGGNGRFTTTYTFGLGDPSIHRQYWFEIASLPMGDYPYAPASSGRVSVTVGGHPR
jgi:hypothetical protein